MGLSEILIFWGYEDFVDIFGGHDKIGLVLGVSSMYLRVFFKVNVQNENIFAWQKFQIFFGVLNIPDIFWRQTVDAGPNPTYEERVRVPPPPPPHTHTHTHPGSHSMMRSCKLGDLLWRIEIISGDFIEDATC